MVLLSFDSIHMYPTCIERTYTLHENLLYIVHSLTLLDLIQHISFLQLFSSYSLSSAQKSIFNKVDVNDYDDVVVQCNHLQVGFTLPCAKAWAWDEINTKDHVSTIQHTSYIVPCNISLIVILTYFPICILLSYHDFSNLLCSSLNTSYIGYVYIPTSSTIKFIC